MADETTTGATPGTGATPAQAAQAQANEATTQPATGEDALGDAGKKVLSEARRAAREAQQRAEAAERERDQLREAQQSDSEKAVTQARREAARERDAFWQGRIRDAEVRGALRGAGITNETLITVLAQAPHFTKLTVTDNGTVEGVSEAVESFKQDSPELFSTKAPDPRPNATAGGGAVRPPAAAPRARSYEDAIAAHIQQQTTR